MRSGANPTPAQTAWVGLGANLGDARATLRAAVGLIGGLADTRVLAKSSVYRTAPVDASGPDFFNAVVEVETRLAPRALLDALLAIERQHDRKRPFRNAPRTLDLDLLLYGDEIIATPALTVPHPRMHHRAFVLAPLAELRPGAVIPGRGRVDQLLGAVAGQQIERLLDG